MKTETSMGAAFRRAGLNTVARELHMLAEKFLRESKSPERALVGFMKVVHKRNDLFGALALHYLKEIDLGQGNLDSQLGNAETAAADQGSNDAQGEVVSGGSIPKTIDVTGYEVDSYRRRPYVRSESTKQAFIEGRLRTTIALVLDRHVNNKRLGDYTRGELPELKRNLIDRTVNQIYIATDDAHMALLVDKIMRHAQVDDNAKVDEFISPEAAAALEKQATAEIKQQVEHTVAGARFAFNQQLETCP